MAPLTITIETFSDTACPWCYFGKINLDRAMEMYRAEHPDVQFEMTWVPFNLNPKAKVSAYEKMDYHLARLGPEGSRAFLAHVEGEAAALGVRVSWEGRCGNTRDSHILLLLAARQQEKKKEKEKEEEEEEGKGQGQGQEQERERPRCAAAAAAPGSPVLQELSDAFFRGAIEMGEDISDRSFLVETAVRAGLRGGGGGGVGKGGSNHAGEGGGTGEEHDKGAEESLLEWLDSEEARAEADALDRYAKEVAGIAAVPSYIVQGRYRVGGNQDPEVFLGLFERIRLAMVGGE